MHLCTASHARNTLCKEILHLGRLCIVHKRCLVARKRPLVKQVKPAEVAEEKSDVTDDFFADPRREQALDLYITQGMDKSTIAKRVGVHRNTINNWFADSRFIEAANRRVREYQASTRLRRTMATGAITNVVEMLAAKAVSEVHTTLTTPGSKLADVEKGKISFAREMMFEYREMRGQERIDFGDDIKRVHVQGQHNVTGEIAVTHSVDSTPFRDYIRKAIDAKVIDVNALEGETQGQLLLKAAEHMLVDTDILDEIEREDLEADAAMQGVEVLKKKDPIYSKRGAKT